MTDPIADMLTRIRNASAVGHKEVAMPYSNVKLAVLKALEEENYISDCKVVTNDKKFKEIIVLLKYDKKQPVITKIDRVSKPGLRVYTKKKKIKPVLSGQGVFIISTNQGVMTSKQAKIKNLGGEVICRVW
jgi:small subunit ribosomal protein S8